LKGRVGGGGGYRIMVRGGKKSISLPRWGGATDFRIVKAFASPFPSPGRGEKMSEFFIFIFIALLRGAYPWMGCGRTVFCHSCLGEGLRKFLVFFLPPCGGRIPGWDF